MRCDAAATYNHGFSLDGSHYPRSVERDKNECNKRLRAAMDYQIGQGPVTFATARISAEQADVIVRVNRVTGTAATIPTPYCGIYPDVLLGSGSHRAIRLGG